MAKNKYWLKIKKENFIYKEVLFEVKFDLNKQFMFFMLQRVQMCFKVNLLFIVEKNLLANI